MNTAILLITFNRFDTVRRVFEQIQIAKPPRLYIASDGARKNIPNEKVIVDEIRQWILDNINWDCQINTLFRDENLGCDKNIPNAINWFFETENAGIILEDDCLPSQTFFKFCELSLEKYESNKNIWHIGGSNSTDISIANNSDSAYLSKCMNCWGWATWKNRWQYFNADLTNYNPAKICDDFKNISEQIYWLRILYRDRHNKLKSWDYQWALNIIEHQGLCVVPCKNLIQNIGFEGTHYKQKKKSKLLARQKNFELENINLPDVITYSNEYDNLLFKKFFRIKSFIFKFLLRFLAEIITFKYNEESSTIIRQIIEVNQKRIRN